MVARLVADESDDGRIACGQRCTTSDGGKWIVTTRSRRRARSIRRRGRGLGFPRSRERAGHHRVCAGMHMQTGGIVRQRSVLSVGVALIAASLALTACGGNNEDGGGGGGGGGTQTVKIGFMGDLTGENSAIVIPPKNGAQLAVDEHNAKNPKVKIQLVTYDSQADPGQAVALAQKAITQDKIVALIGPAFSGESKNVGPI